MHHKSILEKTSNIYYVSDYAYKYFKHYVFTKKLLF